MDTLLRDLRYALRTFARRKIVAVGAISSLAIAIAANTAIFSVVNALLFKPVPGVTRTERLVELSRDVAGTTSDVTYPIFRHLRSVPNGALEDLAAFALETISIATNGEPVVRGSIVASGNYFAMLGVGALRGRLFDERENAYPSVAPVAVITYDLWQREFTGSEDVVGRTVRINGSPVQIIGVLPEGFAGHHTGLLTDVFLPLGLRIRGLPNPDTFDSGNGSSLELLGRLRGGVTTTQAAQLLSKAANEFQRSVGETSPDHPYVVRVEKWGPLPGLIRTPVSLFLSVLSIVVVLALAMACINVTTVLLAQTTERRRELAVRRAMGATQSRLVRQLVTETSLLFLAGGLVGVTATIWMMGLIGGIEPPVPVPGRLGADFSLDIVVLLFSLGLTLGSALIFSVPPALGASRFHPLGALRDGHSAESRSRTRLRSLLVGAQVAATCVLLTATIVSGRALSSLRQFDPGWNADGVFVASMDLELNDTPISAGMSHLNDMLTALSANPDVEVAAMATKLPGGGRSSFGVVTVPGVEPPRGLLGFDAALNRVTAGYLQAMRIPLLMGRDIASSDNESAPRVAIVNATMARRLFGNTNPIGRSFYLPRVKDTLEIRVIGVARDAQAFNAQRAPENFYYVPIAQWYNSQVTLHVRARPGRETSAAAAIRPAVRAVDASIVISSVRTLSEALSIFLLPQRLAAWVSGSMGLFGLLLAGVGIYGVTAFLVARRAREVAIRIALGATTVQVVRLMLRQGLRAPIIGVGIGCALSAVATFGASKVIAGARVSDPAVVLGTPLIIALVVVAAMLLPMRRLLRVSPMISLREE